MGNFFKHLIDTDRRQRDDIEELRDEVRQKASAGAGTADLMRLSDRVDRLAREVDVLRAALTVVSQALVEVGGLDAKVLDARIDAAMAALAPVPAAPTVPCTNCGMSYPPERMAGALCKRCVALADR